MQIEVRTADEVQAAFSFAEAHNVSLSIKSSGHDYKGHSSSVGSLALWVKGLSNLTYSSTFVPQGCSPETSYSALTAGLQYRLVTPDGKYRVANACQNKELFWALRGGGGGTFGLVLDATHKSSLFIYINPGLSLEAARVAMLPLTDWILAQNGTASVESSPTYLSFYEKYLIPTSNPSGSSYILASELIPKFARDPDLFSKLLVTVSLPFGSTPTELQALYAKAHDLAGWIAEAFPDGGVYLNESDVYQTDHETTPSTYWTSGKEWGGKDLEVPGTAATSISATSEGATG
ncbi:hypothetical protein RQP46_000851 [Phenoliferia psychrophenolica]